jgi:hypothetical protein
LVNSRDVSWHGAARAPGSIQKTNQGYLENI